MASAVDSRLAYARLSAVATASRLPTATRGSNNSYTTSWDTTNAISGYMRRLVAEGLLSAEGKTRGRRYALRDLHETYHEIEVSPGLAEDQIWRARIVPQVEGIKQNIIDLCAYGFTEMLNNVVDHSGAASRKWWKFEDGVISG